MFGHTLLRLNGKNGTSHSLLAPTISYAAMTEGEQGLQYAFKGLTGGYPGRFSIKSYYDAVRLYNDIDNRDIWEFRLDLLPKEIDRMLAHLWELRQVDFSYFFLHANCAYQLLSLLEIARPKLELTDSFSYWTVPADTIRAVRATGMIREIVFRPSRASRIHHGVDRLPSRARIALEEVMASGGGYDNRLLHGLSSVEAARVLELAAQLRIYRQIKDQGREDATDSKLAKLLQKRSEIATGPPPQPPVPTASPDQGHPSGRLGIGMGLRDDSFFTELALRPVLHDLDDPPGGYTVGNQVEVLSARLRFYPEKGRLEPESLLLIGARSMTPRMAVSGKWAWQAMLGLEQMLYDQKNYRLTGRSRAGLGRAWQPFDRVLTYGLLNLDLAASDALSQGAAVGLGPELGVLTQPLDNYQLRLTGQLIHWSEREVPASWSVQLTQNWFFERDLAVHLSLDWNRQFAEPGLGAWVRLDHYF
jgi:hypothetical protein